MMQYLTITNLAIGLAAAVLAILLYIVFLYWRNPVLIKIGLRNIPRRPTQSILIVVGLTLSTVIIISSLAIGDTLGYSVRRQAIDAYGATDQILAPPLLSLFAALADEDGSSAEANDAQEELARLTEGGLTTVLTVLEGGLPGISEARFRRLQTEADAEELIDGVAGSIVFPTIIRDVSSGQGEPLGFIFAVDDDYDEQFGLTDLRGQPVEIESLEPGVGNIFAQASNLFALVGNLGAQVGLGNVRVSDVAIATAALGAALTTAGDQGLDLAELSLDLATLQELGIDTTVLENAGIETLSLDSLGLTPERLDALGVSTTTLSAGAVTIPGLDVSAVQTVTNDLLSALNLNTLGRELDSVLAQAGLQLRQGDVYLNRLGAERLNARVGDVLEIYIGPIPVPFRVKAIVEQAGPMAALTPVVMMPLDEAQKLLFMQDKVNAILVSNRGDNVEGIEHTAEVSNILRVLAVDPAGADAVAAILRRPEVLRVIQRTAPDVIGPFGEGDGPPPFIEDLFGGLFGISDMAPLVRGLPDALAEPGMSDPLKAALANQAVREWILEQPLPDQAEADLRNAFTELNEFDLIDPLNKANVVTAAGVGGTVFTSLFSLFGFFSILAGVLLIFLIFVMLAAERRSEMGMARAIGVQRNHLVQMFMTEGLIYDLVAAVLGVMLGLGISYLMVGFIGGLFNTVTGQISEYGGVFSVRFNTTPTSIVIAYCAGVIFTFLVVVLAARRVSRLNIVAAIRDLPEESMRTRRSRLGTIAAWLPGVLFAAAGGILIYYGAASRFSVLLAGITLLLIGVMLMVGRLLARTSLREETIQRIVYTTIGLGLLAVWALPWAAWLDRSVAMGDGPWVLVSFALTMPMIIVGAILVVMFNATILTGLLQFALGGVGALTPVLKTAIAYPLSSRFRTGMAMLLFAIVISTVTIMTVVIEATQTLVAPDSERSAGFEISTSFSILSFFNPIEDLQAEMARNPEFPADQVAVVGAVATAEAEAVRTGDRGRGWRYMPLAGVNAGYLDQAEATYGFALRAPGYVSDADVWDALRSRDDVAIITRNYVFQSNDALENAGDSDVTAPAFIDDPEEREEFEREFGARGRLFGGFSLESQALPEINLTVRTVDFDEADLFGQNSATPPVEHELTVIGVLDARTTLAPEGLQVGPAAFAAVTGEPFVGDNYYVKVVDGADVHEVARNVETAFLSSGLNAAIMAEQFAQGQELTRGILRLFQGFMALGLLVGIAALGVISSRTVVERRQQVGMLRAIGFQPRMVALSFIFEASFIALTGLIIGTLAGLALGRNMVRIFFDALTDGRVFATPWWQIVAVVLLAYAAALLATLVPAFQASRVYPAEALRYE